MIVLGIETSCDETSAAVVIDGIVKSNIISSQLVHSQYGGVVPELASRAHQKVIIQVVEEALARAGVTKHEIEGVASTFGPGLAGALLVGLSFGKALAYTLGIPFTGVNHMEGHLYSNFLAGQGPSYPFLCLIVSGGHTMLVHVSEPFVHRVLGQTRDDAAGEAFDKVAKMLGLGYPGGPAIDTLAKKGNPRAINFPRAFLDDDGYEFSFSGIKTAVLYYLRRQGYLDVQAGTRTIPPDRIPDICASFQAAVVDVLVGKTLAAAKELSISEITMAGGVSANSQLREQMKKASDHVSYRLMNPPLSYCMDNGAMIAYVGWMKLTRGMASDLELSVAPNLGLG